MTFNTECEKGYTIKQTFPIWYNSGESDSVNDSGHINFYNLTFMQAAIDYIRKELAGIYPDREIRSFEAIIFEHVMNYSRIDFHLKRSEPIPPAKRKAIEEIVEKLKSHEPIQYILGEADFYGLKFKVTPAVLIPRPETEELVDWILKTNKLPFPFILDIGTGSGCIPVTLKKEIPEANMAAVDVSTEALEIARSNSEKHSVFVHFIHADILDWEKQEWPSKYDIIVSNPPYVRHLEKEQMERNVLDHEPHLALFVDDENALVFYRTIIEFAKKHLNLGGQLYFEINEAFGQEMIRLMEENGFTEIELHKDLNGKDRMIRGTPI